MIAPAYSKTIVQGEGTQVEYSRLPDLRRCSLGSRKNKAAIIRKRYPWRVSSNIQWSTD